MELMLVLETYFRGERQLGLSFVYLGLAVLAVSYFAWRTVAGPFGTSLALTCLVVGAGLFGAGAWFERKTEAQVSSLQQAVARDAAGTVEAELARMTKVNANWSKARLMWLASGLLGALLLNFVRREAASAVGLAMVFLTFVLFVVDELGERRAAVYTAALERAQATR